MCCLLRGNFFLSLQVMASPRRAAQKRAPTSITCISSTISRLCLNCRTGWSLVLRGQLSLNVPLCQPHCCIAEEQSLAVSSISQDPLGNQRTVRVPGRPQEGAAQSGNSHRGWEEAERKNTDVSMHRSKSAARLLNTWQRLAGAALL